jgi:predicted nucleic acid-binding protein
VTTFVDTSALVALVDATDPNHERARATLLDPSLANSLATHNYVVVEAVALTQRRFGSPAVRDLVERILPLVEVVWVMPAPHHNALSALLASNRRGLSFVDLVSFELMRERDIDTAFAFDRDFRKQGFRTIP